MSQGQLFGFVLRDRLHNDLGHMRRDRAGFLFRFPLQFGRWPFCRGMCMPVFCKRLSRQNQNILGGSLCFFGAFFRRSGLMLFSCRRGRWLRVFRLRETVAPRTASP